MIGPDQMSASAMMAAAAAAGAGGLAGMDSNAMASAAAAAVMQSFLSGGGGGAEGGVGGGGDPTSTMSFQSADSYNSDSNSSNMMGRDEDFDLDSGESGADSPPPVQLGSAVLDD